MANTSFNCVTSTRQARQNLLREQEPSTAYGKGEEIIRLIGQKGKNLEFHRSLGLKPMI